MFHLSPWQRCHIGRTIACSLIATTYYSPLIELQVLLESRVMCGRHHAVRVVHERMTHRKVIFTNSADVCRVQCTHTVWPRTRQFTVRPHGGGLHIRPDKFDHALSPSPMQFSPGTPFTRWDPYGRPRWASNHRCTNTGMYRYRCTDCTPRV